MSSLTTQRVQARELALRSLDQLPPFSPVLNHLIASLASDDVSFAKLAGVIERDTVLSGNVLRLVNSALYGRRGTVNCVRAAVSILGLSKLRNFLLGLSLTKLWSTVKTPPEWSMARFNEHGLAVALLADCIVQKTRVEYPEGAFVAGLLHDMGRLMIAIALPEEYCRIMAARQAQGRRLEECEAEVLEVTHAELSAAALARWNLPAPIQQAVLYHHQPHLDPARGASGTLPLSQALASANEVANSLEQAITPEDAAEARPAGEALAATGYRGSTEDLLELYISERQALQQSL